MKVIFLDLDGVLNTCHSAKKSEVPVHFQGDIIGFNQLDELCVERLNRLTDETDAKLVISSTWREPLARTGQFGALRLHLMQQGVTGDVIGHTPVTFGRLRSHECGLWMMERKDRLDIESYVILDDDLGFFGWSKPNRLVHIENGWVTGLQDEHIDEAIELLSKPCDPKITWPHE